MLISEILKNIKAGNFTQILQIVNLFDNVDSSKQLEQLLNACSHFIYYQEAIVPQQLFSLFDFTNLCIQKAGEKNIEINQESKLKALYYILVHGIKKGFSSGQAFVLSEHIETILSTNNDLVEKNKDIIKKIYTTVWNLSLQNEPASNASIKLQMYALIFLTLSGESLYTICNMCLKVGRFKRERTLSCYTEMATLYKKVLNAICNILKCKHPIESESVIVLHLVVIEYANILLKLKAWGDFSKIFKPLAINLEPICDMQVTMSFKMSVKIVEAGMALTFSQIKEDLFTKWIKGCSIIPIANIASNSIMIDSLLQILVFSEKSNSDIPKLDLSPDLFNIILRTISARLTAESFVSPETLIKVMELFGNHLNDCVCQVTDAPIENRLSKLSEALSNAELTRNFLEVKLDISEKIETCIYNIGVNSCNLGIYAYKLDNFALAAGFFDIGVTYLYYCTKLSQKTNVLKIIKKKAMLLKDSLRLGGQYKEAGFKTLLLALQGIIPLEEIILTWVKCKRDDIKAGKNNLKKITIKDIYDEVLYKEEISESVNLKIEDLLLQEIEGLRQLGLDTVEDEINCANAVICSQDLSYKVEGLINLAQILWSNPGHPIYDGKILETAVNTIHQALGLLKKMSLGDKGQNIILELKARIHFWIYLCELQVIQEQAQAEINSMEKEPQSLSVNSTDLGEEVQPNDACSVRPSTSVTTFNMQEITLKHLNESLDFWEEAVKSTPSVKFPLVACNILLSIVYIYKFCGLLPSTLRALTILLSVSNKCGLKTYWIQGMVEVLNLVPELVSMECVKRFSSTVEEVSIKGDQCSIYLKYEALATLAYLYYKIGQYTIGMELLNKCLMDPIMDKKTIVSCEVQVEVLFVASLYATLPKKLLPNNISLSEPCLFLALYSARKAIGLLMTTVENSSRVFGHNYKIAWLHHKTNMWFGRLCQLTAQPRPARAYLRQALTLAEKFAVPLRTAESLSLLAEIDLQCDQLEDCRVKIDSLDNLLQIHCIDSPSNLKEKLKTANCRIISEHVEASKKKSWKDVISIHEDSMEENMRELNVSPEYKLHLPTGDSYNKIVIGEEDRISQLAQLHALSTSPSLFYREENYVIKKVDCPLGIVECNMCITPEIYCIAIRVSTMMAMIHTQQDNEQGALKCLKQAEKQLLEYDDLSNKITSRLLSILNNITHTELGFSNSENSHLFLQSKMILVKLHNFLLNQEILCLEHNYDRAYSNNLKSLELISNLEGSVIAQNHIPIVQLILLGYSIKNTVETEENLAEIDITLCSSPNLNGNQNKVEVSGENVSTPIRSTSQRCRGKPQIVAAGKVRRIVTADLLTPSSHNRSESLLKPSVPSFSIFPDEEDSHISNSKSRVNAIKSFDKEKSSLQVLSKDNKVVKINKIINKKVLTTQGLNTLDSVETSFNSLTIKSSSPVSDILQLPVKDELIFPIEKPTKTYTARKTKDISKQAKMNGRAQSTKSVSNIANNDGNSSKYDIEIKTLQQEDCENIMPNNLRRNHADSSVYNSLVDANSSVSKNDKKLKELKISGTKCRATKVKSTSSIKEQENTSSTKVTRMTRAMSKV